LRPNLSAGLPFSSIYLPDIYNGGFLQDLNLFLTAKAETGFASNRFIQTGSPAGRAVLKSRLASKQHNLEWLEAPSGIQYPRRTVREY